MSKYRGTVIDIKKEGKEIAFAFEIVIDLSFHYNMHLQWHYSGSLLQHHNIYFIQWCIQILANI